ncbi:MAG: HNH endonuclease [Proteobacteria bacterium]|nr:HNH endonuclease [Pseudomonadota bacterium]
MTDYTITRYNPYTDQELIEAVQKYADEHKIKNAASSSFCKWFGISETTIQRHFDTWANFCKAAGLSPRYSRFVNKEDLLNNLEKVWSELGRQPRAKEIKQPLSPISISRYQKVFRKNWYEICLEFISWKSGASVEEIERELRHVPAVESDTQFNHKTNRNISLSIRYDILKRDNFRCVKCGASPALNPGSQLHIDHKLPWSKGGETEEDNLQTLCSDCNLGKSNKT